MVSTTNLEKIFITFPNQEELYCLTVGLHFTIILFLLKAKIKNFRNLHKLNFALIASKHCTNKWSFPLRISSVNVTKFAVSCGFGHIYWRNPRWKTLFFVQWKFYFFNVNFLLPVFFPKIVKNLIWKNFSNQSVLSDYSDFASNRYCNFSEKLF